MIIASHPPLRPADLLTARMPRLRRLPLRDMLSAAVIVLAATVMVRAEIALQDWIPDVLAMPADAEVVTDRAIGSSVRMFSIETDADVTALFAEWEQSLVDGGFPVNQSVDEGLETSIEFSGSGIANAKIIVAPTAEAGRSVISFDATLN